MYISMSLVRFCILYCSKQKQKHRASLKSPNIWTVIKPRLLLSMQKWQPKPRSFGSKLLNMQWHCLKTLVVRRFSITWATKPRKDSRVGLKVLTTAIMMSSLPNTERQRNCVITKCYGKKTDTLNQRCSNQGLQAKV